MPSAERDRWLALGLLLAALGIGYLLLVHSWWTVPMLAVNQDIADSRERELRVRTPAAAGPAGGEQLAAALARRHSAPLPARIQRRAGHCGLVQRLETVVVQASPGNRSCAITNRSPMPQAARERFERVVVQVRLRCGVPELAAALHALETGTPRLFVDNLNVLAQRYAYVGAVPGAGNGGLDVSFDLYGYLRPVAGAAPVNAARGRQAPATQGGMDGI